MKLPLYAACFALAIIAAPLRAETGYAAWLRYAPIDDPNAHQLYAELPAVVVALDSSPVLASAQNELIRGTRSMLGRTLRIESQLPAENCILLGTLASIKRVAPKIALPDQLADDAYLLKSTTAHGHDILLITAANDRGVLYGAFALLRKIALSQQLDHVDEQHVPLAPIRWTNEWDNLNGTIERGYGGLSIFFKDANVVPDLTRASDYARLLASIGINGCTVNNVNADSRVITPEFLPQLARLADAFRPWGVRISISIDFSSPKTIGHLDTFDPLDPKVIAWWKDKADEIYRAVPDLGGFLLKADSEGRLGPAAYGRSPADAANLLAKALAPHHGVLVYRAFVYNHHLDWRDPKADRARAAYDNFAHLDGKFDPNVIVQIKYGPIDFQVREPVSPLIGALHNTNQALELQVTQEYTGQQRHLCFLLPMWQEILHFDMHAAPDPAAATSVADIVDGKTFRRPFGGIVGVVDVGLDQTWLGSDLAMANLYAFGRIAWNSDLSSSDIIDEWTQLTFGHEARVRQTINNLQLRSWRTYENYTGPLGAGGLTDITGPHYGPGIESSERNGWGQWHRADEHGIGMDRTVSTGTAYIGQYPPPVDATYESLQTMPDNLLLFFHHVPYTYVLHSGKTVIQHIYDSHYEGAAEAQTFPEEWKRLHGLVDEERYEAILTKLEYQAGHAIVWRDAVCDWFFRMSHIADVHGRVGNHPGRIEAESMSLTGYQVLPITPWEDASGGKAVVCNATQCTASTRFAGAPGWYRLSVQYFDLKEGVAHFETLVNGQPIATWGAHDSLPSNKPDAHNSTRRTLTGVALRPGDEIRIVATPDAADHAALDYIQLEPESTN